MASIHVFAIDWVPGKDDIASGGGLRSLQHIEALRQAGHRVTFSVPINCRMVRHLGRDSPRLRHALLHDHSNQYEILQQTQADVAFWVATLIRNIPSSACDILHVCDLIGLPHIEASMGAAGLVASMHQRVVGLCAEADLVLTGSEEQHGYWQAELTHSTEAPTMALVPFALPTCMKERGVTRTSRLTRLHVTGMVYAWSTSVALLERAAAWVERQRDVRLSVITGVDPGGATDHTVIRRLNAIAAKQGVTMRGEVSFREAMQDYQAGSVALDLYEPSLERGMAVPIRTVNALLHGVPIVTTIDSLLTRRLERAGAAMVVKNNTLDELEAALNALAAMPARQIGRMSAAARGFAEQEWVADDTAATLVRALDAALQKRNDRRRNWHAPRPEVEPLGHVLVISDAGANLRDLRIDLPFGALHGRGLISGYSVWCMDEFSMSTSVDPSVQDFDAVWVQREISPNTALALKWLDQPFVYDLDDNLLASPGYRQPFKIEMQQATRNLIWSCAVLSCSTSRLAQTLQGPALRFLIDKAVVTPSLLREPPAPRPSGEPRFLLWISSDAQALTTSRQAICRAIRDFCLTHDLTLVCIGVAPPDLLIESSVRLERVAHVPYGSYLSLLRSFAPAIMACPLETDAEAQTQSFIDCKSDIKMLECLGAGLVGVFSRARPYLDSNLTGNILCDNSYVGWFEALTEAKRQGTQGGQATLPPYRCAATLGLWPWFEALRRARLRRPLPSAAFRDALRLLRARYGRRLLTEPEFDESFYLRYYPDVHQAVEDGVIASGFEHYESKGFHEGRLGRRGDVVEPHDDQVWSNLLNTLGDLRETISGQAREIEVIKARRETRLRMRR